MISNGNEKWGFIEIKLPKFGIQSSEFINLFTSVCSKSHWFFSSWMLITRVLISAYFKSSWIHDVLYEQSKLTIRYLIQKLSSNIDKHFITCLHACKYIWCSHIHTRASIYSQYYYTSLRECWPQRLKMKFPEVLQYPFALGQYSQKSRMFLWYTM